MSVSVATVALATDAETLIEMLPDQVFVPKSVGSAKVPVGVNVPVKGITTGAIGPLTVSVTVTVPLSAADALVVASPNGGSLVSVTSPFSASMIVSMWPPGWAVMSVVSPDDVTSLAPCAQFDVKLGGKNRS